MSDIEDTLGKTGEFKRNAASSSVKELPSKAKTEAEFLEDLRRLQTNLLFLYGDHQAGKSAICSSLIYYLMTHPVIGKFTDRVQQSEHGQDFIRRSIGKISEKRFLERTPLESVSLAGGRFEPANSAYKSIPITFMEMAGEDLRSLVAPRGSSTFPNHVEVFLNDKELELTFILVVRHNTVSHERDLMLADFIDYLRSKDERFVRSKILLLVSQWDSYKGDKSINGFVKSYLPLTFSALTGRGSSIATYSVGDVSVVDGAPYISRLDEQSPEKLIRWIYSNISGRDFLARTAMQRFVSLLRLER